METVRLPTDTPASEQVIELPIRDGNFDRHGRASQAIGVIELPIRDGNRRPRKGSWYQA